MMLDKERNLWDAVYQFLTSIRSMQKAAEEYELSCRGVYKIEEKNLGLKKTNKKLNRAIGLEDEDFSSQRIDDTIRNMEDAAKKMQYIYDRLLRGKTYRYILKLSMLVDLIDEIVQYPERYKSDFSVDAVKENWSKQMLNLQTGYFVEEEGSYRCIVHFPVWVEIVLGKLPEIEFFMETEYEPESADFEDVFRMNATDCIFEELNDRIDAQPANTWFLEDLKERVHLEDNMDWGDFEEYSYEGLSEEEFEKIVAEMTMERMGE